MNSIKKVLAMIIVLSMVFAFGMSAVSFADDPETGTITVSNAYPETKYELYKAFDAKYVEGKDEAGNPKTFVSYTLDASTTNGAKLLALIQAEADDDAADWEEGDDPICSFQVKKIAGENELYEISQKAGFPEAAGRGWLKGHLDLLTKVDTQTCGVNANEVVFENVAPGYYLVTATDKGQTKAGAMVTVTTNTPDAVIIDKNPRTPDDLYKDTPVFSEEIGETVPFTVGFNAVNFRTNEIRDTNRIMKYVFDDTVVNGLDFLDEETDNTVFGDENGTIMIYRTKTVAEDGTITYSDPLTFKKDVVKGEDEEQEDYEARLAAAYPNIEYTYDADTHRMTVIWGDEVKDANDKVVGTTSRYPSNVYVVFKYDMRVNHDTYQPDADGTKVVDAENKITGYMKLESKNELEKFGEDEDIVKNIALSIRKLDGNNQNIKLEGAEFALYKEGQVTKRDKDGKVVTDEETGKPVMEDGKLWYLWDETTQTIKWIEYDKEHEDWYEDEPSIVVADNNTSTAEFWGLKEGTYYIREVKAPDGYKIPDTDWTVEISKATNTQKVDKDGEPVVDAKGNPVYEEANVKPGEDYLDIKVNNASTTLNTNGIRTTEMLNYNSNALPETGGIGTTIFYVLGGIFAVAAGVLLITRKRVGA